jgi:hypothetical protein
MQVPNIFYLTFSFKFLNFSLQVFLLFVPEMPASLRLTLFRLSTLPWLGSCNHWIVAYFLLS